MYKCNDCECVFEEPVYLPEWSLDGVDLIGETLTCPACASSNLTTFQEIE